MSISSMSAAPEVVVDADASALAADVVTRLIAILTRAQQERGSASLGLTGGSILEQVFTGLAEDSTAAAVDWSRVDVFWGDERFVAADSSDRNDLVVDRLLFDRLPFDPARIHRMPSTDGPDGNDVEAAARSYADELATFAANEAGTLSFDVILVGVGPDGHCCSLFPGHPALSETDLVVVGVHDSPKPPPIRISLTFQTLAAIDEVWVIASGDGKADAVARALGGADPIHIPSAGARGRLRTVWLVDQAAAAQLPKAD